MSVYRAFATPLTVRVIDMVWVYAERVQVKIMRTCISVRNSCAIVHQS